MIVFTHCSNIMLMMSRFLRLLAFYWFNFNDMPVVTLHKCNQKPYKLYTEAVEVQT